MNGKGYFIIPSCPPRLPACALLVGAVVLVVVIAAPDRLQAQGYVGEVTVTTSFLEMRPLVRDSVPEEEVDGEGLRRRMDDGTIATCRPGTFCRWYRSGDVENVRLAQQDLRLTAWPGVRGLSAHVQLRGRFGTDDFWPLSGQELEAVAAYASFDGGDYRIRGGRQVRVDGLGFYNFDGLEFLWRGFSPLRIEAYGGLSLAPGLNVPRTGSLLEEAEALPPDDRGLIFGAEISGRAGYTFSGSLGYQREIRTDRLALFTERLAMDARALLEEVVLDFSAEYDLIFREFNELRLQVDRPLVAGLEASAQVRRRKPFFEQWTIWGAFRPVGFTEGQGSLSWSLSGAGLSLQAGGGYRDYDDTGAGSDFARLREDGWRVFGEVSWRDGPWLAGGGYRAEAGPGAARFGGDVRVGRSLGAGRRVVLRGSSTQTFGEFRMGDQRINGGGLEVSWTTGDLTIHARGEMYRLVVRESPAVSDWTQARANLRLSYGLGSRPSPASGGTASFGAGEMP